MTDVTFSVPPTYQNDNGMQFQSCFLIGTPYIFCGHSNISSQSTKTLKIYV